MPYIRVRGVDLHYEEHGSPGDPPLILAHGLMGSVAFMERFDEHPAEIAARGLRVIAYDARGHGRSGYTTRRRDYHWDALAEDLFGLMQGLEIPGASVCGGSMGAGTALMLALAHPKAVDRLILRAAPPFGDDLKPAQRLFGGLATLYQVAGSAATARIVTALPSMRKLQDANSKNDLRSFFRSQRRAAVVPAIRGLLLDKPQIDVTRFAALHHKALILTHPGDDIHPLRSGELLRDLMPHASLAVAPTQAYWQENPNALTHVIASFALGQTVAEGLPEKATHAHVSAAPGGVAAPTDAGMEQAGGGRG